MARCQGCGTEEPRKGVTNAWGIKFMLCKKCAVLETGFKEEVLGKTKNNGQVQVAEIAVVESGSEKQMILGKVKPCGPVHDIEIELD